MAQPLDQPARMSGEGGVTSCETCGREKSCTEDEATGEIICESCRDNAAELAYERQQEEPCFRGGEWAAAQAHEADWIRRNLK